MNLTATAVKQTKPKEKQYKLFDGRGLFLLVHQNGGKYWRFKYRHANKEKLLALGVYPDVSLAEARERHQQARKILAKGIDPSEAQKVEKLTRHLAAVDTFEALAREWHSVKMCTLSEGHQKRTLTAMENNLFPYLGRRPVGSMSAPELLADADGDGIDDLLVQDGEGRLNIFLSSGDASLFSSSPTIINVRMPSDPELVAVADLNRDGKVDLVMRHEPIAGLNKIVLLVSE
tara:strand:+ start:62 stop:757 length:696 start_codon:yes stop_codon:yes gene_type:complete